LYFLKDLKKGSVVLLKSPHLNVKLGTSEYITYLQNGPNSFIIYISVYCTCMSLSDRYHI